MKKISHVTIFTGLFIIICIFFLASTLLPSKNLNLNITKKEITPAPVDNLTIATKNENFELANNLNFCNKQKGKKIQSLKDIEASRSKELISFFDKLQKKNISWNQLDLIAELAGITPVEASFYLPDPHIESSIKHNIFSNIELANNSEKKVLESLLINNNLNDIKLVLGNEASKKIINGIPFSIFVLQKTKSTSLDTLNNLSAQGLKPTLLDLIYAMKKKLDYDIIHYLITNIDINPIWKEGDKLQSLSLIATRQLNLDVLTILLEKYSQHIAYSELDYLPIPSDEKKEYALKILEVLLENDRMIKTRLGYRKLMTWIPEHWKNMNKDSLINIETELNENAKKHLKSLNLLIIKFSKQSQITKKFNALCKTKKRLEKTQNDNLSFEKQYEILNDKLTNSITPFSLGKLYHFPLEGELAIIKNKFYQGIIQKNWIEVLETLPPLQNTEVGELALDSAIMNAIISDAPLDVIVELLALGAELPANTIQILAQFGNKKLAYALLPYGLNLKYIDLAGMNAIEYLVYHNADSIYNQKMIDMVKFLMDYGVSLAPLHGGLDALNFALIKLDKSDTAIAYSLMLIHFGSQVKSSHFQQMKKLKNNNKNRYLKIIEIIPILDASDS